MIHFHIDSRGKYAMLQFLNKHGCLHRSDFEDFIMDPEYGLRAPIPENRGVFM